MPAIWNVGNINNVNNKKVFSKLTFDVGERFSGKIVKIGDSKNEVMIKLVDGWQFVAELDTPMEEVSQGLVRFQVDGFENGKLKLKLVGEKDKGDKGNKDVLESFLESEGLSKEDGDIIAKMIKHNMNLSRENVLKIKSILQFQKKLANTPEEGEVFINNYLSGKGLDSNSLEGKKVASTLKEFFQYFKSINEEDLLMFLENNIDLTKENIKSFENLFKNSGGLYKNIKSIGKELNEIMKTLGREVFKDETSIKPELNSVNYKENTTISNMALGEDSDSKNMESGKEIRANSEIIKTKNGEIVLNYDRNMRTNILNNIYNSTSSGTKINMLQLLKAVTTNDTDIIKYIFQDVLSKKPELSGKEGIELYNKFVNQGDKEIFLLLKNVAEEFKLSLKSLQKPHIEEALNRYFGRNISLTEEEFNKIDDTIKYLIKSNFIDEHREDNILKGNLESKEIEQGQNKEFIKEPIGQLKEMISLDNDKNNIVKNLSSNEIIKKQIKEKSEEIKTIIGDILNNVTNGDEELSQRIFQLIKNNISDFKVFNSISNQYYYMDLPINLHEQEYPCKLIVKDDRKNGKRIDSTNVKLVISVDTVNLGVVDGYVKVRDKNISIDLKCKEEFVKAFSLGKVNLERALEALGYIPHIYVTKKLEPVNLTNCREFFNDNNISTINRMV